MRLFASSCALLLSGCLLFGCSAVTKENSPVTTFKESEVASGDKAAITAVGVSGDAASEYTFSVTIESPDEGCTQYADWWEVVTEDGTLLYRRILAHSHVEEQPFTRSGGPVAVSADDVLVVRSHMNSTGYSSQAMKGTIREGFEAVTLPANFAIALSEVEPQPSGCAF